MLNVYYMKSITCANLTHISSFFFSVYFFHMETSKHIMIKEPRQLHLGQPPWSKLIYLLLIS